MSELMPFPTTKSQSTGRASVPRRRLFSRKNFLNSRRQMTYIGPELDHRCALRWLRTNSTRYLLSFWSTSSLIVLPVRRRKTSFSVGFLKPDGQGFNGERVDQLRNEFIAPFSFERQTSVLRLCGNAKGLFDLLQCLLIVGSHKMDDITVYHLFEPRRRVHCNDLPVVHDGDAIAVLRLFHIVGGHENGDLLFFPERVDEIPDRVPRLRVEAERRLVQEQHTG